MNLNEECLLNFLINPDDLNKLNVMLGDFYIQHDDKLNYANSFIQDVVKE